MNYKLSDIAFYAKDRVEVSSLDIASYISTENMLPEKAGITVSSGLPKINSTQGFQPGDVLVSNIRPYFKKIWKATFAGGCSNDVLVFRPSYGINSDFLYLVLCNDSFFDYMVASSKGTKMPRGDKASIMNYAISEVSLKAQMRIVGILKPLIDKIAINEKINDNLQQQAFALFQELLHGHECSAQLSDYVYVNPERKLSKGEKARCIDMSKLSTTGAFPSGWEYHPYNGGMKFTNGDTILARITPCLENGKTAMINFLEPKEVAYGSTEYIVLTPKFDYVSPGFVYCLSRYSSFVSYATKNMNGSSGRQRVSGETIALYNMPAISQNEFIEFGKETNPFFDQILSNSLENKKLETLRDLILPKLLSGEIEIMETNS